MPAKRFLTLALIVLMLLTSCVGSSGSDETADDDGGEATPSDIDSDGDGFTDEEEEAAGSDPASPDSRPDDASAPGAAETFVAEESFDESPDDACNDGAAAVECTGEFDTCEAGMVGDLLAVRCDGIVLRDGTVLSYAAQREVVADGINVRWGCQAEPETGSTSCIFDVLENDQSLIGGPCEYDGELVDDALVLSLPSVCSPIPDEVSQRISDSSDFVGQSSTAAAFLNDQDQPVHTRVGTTSPISIEEMVPVL